MDPILALAILSLGIFAGVVVTGLFYIAIVRPNLLDDEDQPYPPLRTDTEDMITMSGFGGGSTYTTDDLYAAVQELHHRVETGQGNDQILEMVQQISDRLAEQNRQLGTLSEQVSTNFKAQETSLNAVVSQMDMQTGILANANAILEDLGDSKALTQLANRFTDLGERVDEMAETLMSQDELVREVHAQIAPANAAETLYSMMGSQAVHLNDLARHMKQLDDKLGQIRSGTGQPEDVSRLQQEFDKMDSLSNQLSTQESSIRRMLDQVARQSGDVNASLREQTAQLGKLDARIDEQTDMMTSITERLSQVNQSLSESPKPQVVRQDRLTDIKGIGPVYAGLLYEAGVENFDQLAAFSPDELLGLIDMPKWKRIDADGVIEQAQRKVANRQKLEASS